MSVAVAVRKAGRIVVAADTQQNFGSNLPGPGNLDETKIRKIGQAYLASSGWGLYENILDDILRGKRPPSLGNRKEIFGFFVRLWRELHKRYSFVNDQCQESDSPFGDLDASFLVAVRRRIYHVAGDMSVCEFLRYHAIGSGCDFAIGAMHALYDSQLDAEQIARRAVQAAIDHNAYCGGEIHVYVATRR